MVIKAFSNRGEEPLTVGVDPWGDTHLVPHLATLGIRYAPKAADCDRSSCDVSPNRVEFWCEADGYEVDLVLPSAFDRLLWDICVRGGCCGGLVDGVPTHVEGLLPEVGEVTAQAFVALVSRAEGYAEGEGPSHDQRVWLEARFVEHMGAQSAPAATLRRNLRRPFDDA